MFNVNSIPFTFLRNGFFCINKKNKNNQVIELEWIKLQIYKDWEWSSRASSWPLTSVTGLVSKTPDKTRSMIPASRDSNSLEQKSYAHLSEIHSRQECILCQNCTTERTLGRIPLIHGWGRSDRSEDGWPDVLQGWALSLLFITLFLQMVMTLASFAATSVFMFPAVPQCPRTTPRSFAWVGVSAPPKLVIIVSPFLGRSGF